MDNIEAIAKQCEDAGLVGAANTIRLLQSENIRLSEGEDVVRKVLVETYVSCVKVRL